jgi:hypothetical protein
MTTRRVVKVGASKKNPKQRSSRATTKSGLDIEWIGKNLGAEHSFPVTTAPDGAFGAAGLALEVAARLESRGGRPSDPEASLRRLVPMKKSVWRGLEEEARAISTSHRRVSPGQLAAVLVEKGLAGVRKGR